VITLDVVIPSLGRSTLVRTLDSLALGTTRPDCVTIVSNEVGAEVVAAGLDARVVRFESDRYPYGDRDVALRRNVGIFSSRCSHVLTFDDDQIAPRSMIEDVRRLLESEPVVWGHHRFLALEELRELADIVDLPPGHGAAREHPPNAWHGWQSCYGGLFAAERAVVEAVGGFDLAFSGRHAGEDQDLGRRLARRLTGRDRVYVHEPPFAWHPTERVAWPAPARRNVCRDGEHRRLLGSLGAAQVKRCRHCPWFVVTSAPRGDDAVLPYDPALVRVRAVEL